MSGAAFLRLKRAASSESRRVITGASFKRRLARQGVLTLRAAI